MTTDTPLSSSLEDYLETVYLLVQKHQFARVRDIAADRGVKAASVSPALQRLADMGLLDYSRREYVRLTEKGEHQALQVLGRHQVLSTFLQTFLRMPPEDAERDACAMEHSLSPQAMDGLVRFLEYATVCPEGSETVLSRFHRCSRVHAGLPPCDRPCTPSEPGLAEAALSEVETGARVRILRVHATGAVRQRLLDLGLLPGVPVHVVRRAPGGDPLWIQVLNSQIALRSKEAEAVKVQVVPPDAPPLEPQGPLR